MNQRTSTINDHVHMLRRLLLQVFADMYAVNSGGKYGIILEQIESDQCHSPSSTPTTWYDPEKCSANIRTIGAKHASLKDCGFSGDIWELFGEIFVEVITGMDLMATNKEACR